MHFCSDKHFPISESMEGIEDVYLRRIRDQFFARIPFGHSFIKSQPGYVGQNQYLILNKTILHESNKCFPIKRSYQLTFLKGIMKMLESCNLEVIAPVYHEYVKLLNKSDASVENFSHFNLGGAHITIEEEGHVVTKGTTGLIIWEAGKILAEYCLDNKEIFQGKRILEVGCGLGLTGLAVIMNCEPKNYCFTDNHEEVLRRLIRNIDLNLVEQCSCRTEKITQLPGVCSETVYCGTNVIVANCSWNDLGTSKLCQYLKPDLILAADVVYDSNSFAPFCASLSLFLQEYEKSGAIVSCTLRNENTIKEFVDSLHEKRLQEKIIYTRMTWNSTYSYMCEVKIFFIQFDNKNNI